MKPIRLPESDVTYMMEGCGDLPAVSAHDEDGNDYVITAWEISPEEMKKLNETGVIYLSVRSHGIQPVLLTVDNPILSEEGEGND